MHIPCQTPFSPAEADKMSVFGILHYNKQQAPKFRNEA